MHRKKENTPSSSEGSLTQKGRPFLREEIFMSGLSDAERKAYEECMALLQGITENGSIEEACEWLEEFAEKRDRDSSES